MSEETGRPEHSPGGPPPPVSRAGSAPPSGARPVPAPGTQAQRASYPARGESTDDVPRPGPGERPGAPSPVHDGPVGPGYAATVSGSAPAMGQAPPHGPIGHTAQPGTGVGAGGPRGHEGGAFPSDYAAAYRSGAPAFGAPASPQTPYTARQSPGTPPRRGFPAWMVLSGMLVVALIAGGVGGVAGALLNGSGAVEAAPEEEGPVMNEPPPEAPKRDPDTIAGVSQRVSPSVVSIQSSSPRIQGGGSGFVIEGNYVVTNDHVSSELESDGMIVEYSDGSRSDASVVGSDPSSDLAVLSLEDPVDVEPLEFGDSEQVIVGDEVIAIGAPLGLTGTVTQGIISAVNRPVSSGEGENASRFYALQTDAAINPGNSGGPLVDLQGRVIGVNSMIVTMGYMGEPSGNIGLGFAIPSNEVDRVVQRLVEDGETTYADIGADIDLDSPIAGAVIAEGSGAVDRNGPADEAGLESGDVIISLNGRRVSSGQELLAMLRGLNPGEEVEIEYERDGERETTTITLGSSDD
ncbi:trypsin-like peptidase domain-containing protein [Nocardiopsis sp. ATB16-24]|uniref:trypsin-like peptidase domain-containing protein n=1 Tax=Nocardiopsis sp. ATB16-24 TaxID=3019555 RepID=UPI002554C4F8|nr:trypsin-like peptidase domain-containing protein [Nocardiopsis sp. ATB16-24]